MADVVTIEHVCSEPRSNRAAFTALAKVLLPEPDRPVNQRMELL